MRLVGRPGLLSRQRPAQFAPGLDGAQEEAVVTEYDSEISRLLSEMREALRQWRLASEETNLAMEVFKDSGGNSDGVEALRRATALHAQAWQRYVKAIETFTKAKPGPGRQ